LLLPLALHLAAAALHRYPYGGHVKFSMYAAPMIYFIMGLGLAVLLCGRGALTPRVFACDLGPRGEDTPALDRNPIAAPNRAARVALLLIGAIGAGSIVSDVITPYKTTADVRQRALAQWLWHDGNFEDRTVCIKDDLGQSFSPRTWTDLGWSAMYLCNKYIYTPRHLVREPRPPWAPAPATRYLRCVLYRDPGKGDFDQPAFDRWLAEMKEKHPFVGMDRFPLPRHDTKNKRLVTIDYIELYKFEAGPP
jgi:hypothetical protein